MTLILIRQLAVADLLYTLTTTLTMFLSLVTGSWLLGPHLCYILSHVRWWPATAGHLLVLVISLHRIWTIHFAINRLIKVRHIAVLSVVSWTIAVLPTASAVVLGARSCYDDVFNACASTFYDMTEYKAVLGALSFVFLLLPMVLVTILNIGMLYISFKLSDKISTRGLRTVFCICGFFVLCILPYNVAVIFRAIGKELTFFHEVFYHLVYLLNSACNPILYTTTNSKFRGMLGRMIKIIFVTRRTTYSTKSKEVGTRAMKYVCTNEQLSTKVVERVCTKDQLAPK